MRLASPPRTRYLAPHGTASDRLSLAHRRQPADGRGRLWRGPERNRNTPDPRRPRRAGRPAGGGWLHLLRTGKPCRDLGRDEGFLRPLLLPRPRADRGPPLCPDGLRRIGWRKRPAPDRPHRAGLAAAPGAGGADRLHPRPDPRTDSRRKNHPRPRARQMPRDRPGPRRRSRHGDVLRGASGRHKNRHRHPAFDCGAAICASVRQTPKPPPPANTHRPHRGQATPC